MWWIIGGIVIFSVLTIIASLKVASDADDEMGWD